MQKKNATMGKNTRIAAVLFLFLFVGFGSVGWALLQWRESPEMKEARRLQERVLNDKPRDAMTPEQRANLLGQLKTKAKGLSERERAVLIREYAERKNDEVVNAYFALKSPQERTAFLDRVINRKAAAKAVAKDGKGMNGKGGIKEKTKSKPATGKDGRRDGLRNYLDSGTPEERARSMEFYEAMKARMQQRGLSP